MSPFGTATPTDANPLADPPEETPGIVRRLAPASLAVAEGFLAEIAGETWPDELETVARAVDKRRREFVAGRVLARRALAAFGVATGPILADADRVPGWPAGFTGSIAHTDTYAAAVAAPRGDIAGVGVDVEDAPRFRPELERAILTPDEIKRLTEGRDGGLRQARLAAAFCAKEAYYKAQFPLARRRLGFRDVELELDPAAGVFEVWRLARPDARFRGRFALEGPLAAAVIWFAPDETARL
jgi:4'-phosphopantetheinyl transferase EntD